MGAGGKRPPDKACEAALVDELLSQNPLVECVALIKQHQYVDVGGLLNFYPFNIADFIVIGDGADGTL